jgi:hypothetical protein
MTNSPFSQDFSYPLSRLRERVRVRVLLIGIIVFKNKLKCTKNPHPRPFSRKREKGEKCLRGKKGEQEIILIDFGFRLFE